MNYSLLLKFKNLFISISKIKLFRKMLALIIIIVPVFYIFNTIINNWNKLKVYHVSFDMHLLYFSIATLFIAYIIYIFLWMKLLKEFGSNISFKKNLAIWWISQLGKYLPGKIWAVFGKVILSKKAGIRKSISLKCIYFELLLSIIAGILFSIIAMQFWPKNKNISIYSAFLIIGVICMVLLYSGIYSKIYNKISKRLKVENEINLNISFKSETLLLIAYIIQWSILGLAFFIYAKSIYNFPLNYYSIFAGIFCISYILGLISFFAPGGLAVREGVLIYLLNKFIPQETSIIIGITSRIWMALVEIILISVAFMYYKKLGD